MPKLIIMIALVFAMLSPANAQIQREPNFDIVVQKGKKTRYTGTDYDNKSDAIQFTVKIKNKEFTTDYRDLTATLYIFGESANRRNVYQLLGREDIEFNLARNSTYEFESSSIDLEYDDNLFAKYGVKYSGYALIIKDTEGEIIKSRTTKKKLVKHLKKLRDVNINQYFDDDLELISR